MGAEFARIDEEEPQAPPIPLFDQLKPPPLPVAATPLLGRDDALHQLCSVLTNPDVWLVTLTGPGGIGKTRLALSAAAHVQQPVAFVSLASLSDSRLIASLIAQVLGIELTPEMGLGLALRRALSDRHLLLVLDNFEHLLDGRDLVSTLHGHVPGLKVLVTSRVRLSIYGEHVVPVTPLSLPTSRSLNDIRTSSAVRLFVERSRAAAPSFVLSEQNAEAVGAICRHLDGLPLAIELAAARSNLLPPEALAKRLERGLSLLTAGPQDAPARHRTMRATIAWSYELLDEEERRFWERLGVFVGGFTAEAAEVVGNGVDAGQQSISRLQPLIDHGLLLSSTSERGEPRFQMLETTREFALERLSERGDIDQARTDHASWFRGYAASIEPGLMGTEADLWFGRAEADIANLRSALGWLRDRGATAAAMEMAASLGWFWTAPNYIAEGRAWFASLLEAAGDDIDPALRAKTLQSAGDLANWQNDSDDALSLLRQAAALWTLAGDESRVAECLRGLGSVAIDRGEFAEAVELLEDVVTRSRAAGNPWNAAASANLLGLALKEVGQLDAAVQCHEEALVGWQRSGSDDHLPVALNTLGLALMSASDVSRAAESFDAAISLAGEDEFTYEAALSIVGFAHVAASRDDSAAAVQLLASEASQRSQLALPLRPHIQLEVDQLADRLRSQLGNAAFAMHWSNGRSLSFAETIAIARSVNVTLASSDVDLSRREREVLRLLVEGASDNEIAEELFISRRTASKHVAAILEKLGSSNRTAAATAALRKGLV